MAYRNAECSQKGSPRIHWIIGGLQAKIKREKDISLVEHQRCSRTGREEKHNIL